MVTKEMSKKESDFLKGIAALFVIVAHYCQWYCVQADAGLVCTLLTKLGRYGVSIFFAVSGYGLVCSARKGMDHTFLRRRLLNVYFPYLIITGIINVFEGVKWNITVLVRWLLGVDTWFVLVIMIFYLVFYIVWKNCKKKILILFMSVLLVSIGLALCTKDSTWYSSNFSFLVGIMVKVYYEQFAEYVTKHRVAWFVILPICFGVSAVIYMLAMSRNQVIYIGFKVLASVLWSVCVLSFVTQKNIAYSRFVEVIGSVSLECYLLHKFILAIVEKRIDMPLVVMFVSIAVTVTIAYWFHKIYQFLVCRNGGEKKI